MAGRIHLLECLSDYLSYVVLAPFIGPERAAQTIAQNAIAPPAREAERAGTEFAPGRLRAAESAPDAEDTDEAGEAEEPSASGEATERAEGTEGEAVETSATILSMEELAAPVGATLGEVGEDDAGEQRNHDDDDKRDFAGAEDPTDLDLAQIEDGEQGDKHRQRHPRPGARQFSL